MEYNPITVSELNQYIKDKIKRDNGWWKLSEYRNRITILIVVT